MQKVIKINFFWYLQPRTHRKKINCRRRRGRIREPDWAIILLLQANRSLGAHRIRTGCMSPNRNESRTRSFAQKNGFRCGAIEGENGMKSRRTMERRNTTNWWINHCHFGRLGISILVMTSALFESEQNLGLVSFLCRCSQWFSVFTIVVESWWRFCCWLLYVAETRCLSLKIFCSLPRFHGLSVNYFSWILVRCISLISANVGTSYLSREFTT